MNAQTPITATVPKAVRDGIYALDDILGTVWDAALVVDYLNEKGNSDLAYRASHPLLGDLKRAREILSSIWDEAMGKKVAK
jgi:hypothetical protein